MLNDVERFIANHAELVILKISHFQSFNQQVFNNTVAMIRATTGLSLVTAPLESRLGDMNVGDLLKRRDRGTVLVVADKDGDTDYLAGANASVSRGIHRYRDWYASDPENGDLTVFDIFSDTREFPDMSLGTANDPDSTNARQRNGTRLPQGQFPKFALFDGNCRDLAPRNIEVQCDMFLLSWTLTPDAESPVGIGLTREPNSKLARFSADRPKANDADRVINLLYTDEVETSRSVDVALIRNKLV